MQKVIDWILYSSVNAEKYSLFVKSLAGFIPTFILFLSFVHVNVTSDTLTAVLDSVATAITAIGSAVLAISTVYGATRKVVTTRLGTNQVLNNYY